MRTFTALAFVLFAGAALAADDKDAVKKDMAALQGEWTMTSGKANGNDLPEDRVKAARRIVKDGVTTIKFGDEVYMTAKFTLDASKKPREIDYTITSDGDNKGKVIKGIYEIDGDTVKFCFGQPDGNRPEKFESKEDSGNVLSIWKKAKKDK